MFSEYDSPVVSFSSITHSKRDGKESATQTIERQQSEQAMQAVDSKSMATETEAVSSGPVHFNEQSLIDFLKRVAPLVSEELEAEVDFSEIDQDGSEEDSSLIRLNVYETSLKTHKVSSLSWNCIGGTLAIAFGAVRHEAWCNHESQVVLYRMATQAVTQTFLTPSCVTCIKFHSNEPSMILAGLYNGEIRLWDLRKDADWEITDSSGEHGLHVIQVGWCGENTFFTAYSDGCIVLRKISTTNKTVTVLERNYVNSKFPDHDEGLDIINVGQLTADMLVVGTGTGGLLQCTLSAHQPLTRRPEYKDPVTLIYQPHYAVITSVRSGPTGKTFASSSSDGQIRVYKLNEKEARYIVNITECPLDIFWTNSPSIFGVCGSQNTIRFINAIKGQALDVTFELLNNETAIVAETMKNRDIVAVGNTCGMVETWRISLLKPTQNK